MENVRRKTINDPDMIKIDLTRLAWALWHRAWLLLLAAVLFGCGAYIGTKKLITPTYRSSFTAYVNNRPDTANTALSSSDIDAARSLVSTYRTILVSEPLLEDAAKKAGLTMSFSELSRMVSTEIVNSTEVIQVNVTMEDPKEAKAFAKALAKQAPAYIKKIVEGSSMQIVSEPKLPSSIYEPNYLKNTGMGAAFGIILSAAWLIFKDISDNRVKEQNELEERYGIPVIGTIPDLEKAGRKSGYGYAKGYAKVSASNENIKRQVNNG